MSGGSQSADEFVEKDAVDAVIVGDQKMHSEMAPRRQRGCKRGMAEGLSGGMSESCCTFT
jgi:hypothetical protein